MDYNQLWREYGTVTLLIPVITLFAVLTWRENRRCAKCGKHTARTHKTTKWLQLPVDGKLLWRVQDVRAKECHNITCRERVVIHEGPVRSPSDRDLHNTDGE